MLSVRRFVRGPGEKEDAGFTVIELVIALAIFSVFLTIVLSSIAAITKASSKVQVTAQSSSAELAAFQRLDHQIRYSDAINFPGVGSPSGDPYVEFRTPAVSEASGITLCTQWRFDLTSHSLQQRTWNDVAGATPGAWQTNLTNVANDGGAAYPFQLRPAVGAGAQQLVFTVDSGNVRITGAKIISTFVARNSSIQSPSNADDHVAGASDTPVCLAGFTTTAGTRK